MHRLLMAWARISGVGGIGRLHAASATIRSVQSEATSGVILPGVPSPTFYVPEWQPPPSAALAKRGTASTVMDLSAEDARHARRSLRLHEGAAVFVMNGAGWEAAGRLLYRGARDAAVELMQVNYTPPPAVRVRIACAIPKGDRAEQIVQQCSELGVDRLSWLHWERSVVTVRDKKYSKWDRHAIESLKQCGRPYLMEIEPEQTLHQFLSDWIQAGGPASGTRMLLCEPNSALPVLSAAGSWFLHPAVAPPSSSSSQREDTTATHVREVVALVGPEGGLSLREAERLAEAGVWSASLGPNILRVETAAVCVAAALVALRAAAAASAVPPSA